MRREVAADQYGVQLTMAALKGRPEASRQMGICGMFVFFIALELLERSVIYADCHADLLGMTMRRRDICSGLRAIR